jgi:hypothetical protein
MTPKKIVQEFYKSDAMLDVSVMDSLLHPEASINWNSSKGFVQLSKSDILNLSKELAVAYIRSKTIISHLVQDGNTIVVKYDHYVKTIENPREDMLLAHFMIIWEIKDNLLYKGFQISQTN